MRPLVLLVLIAAPSMARAEWNVDSRTDESPPYHAVSQDSRPAGLTLGFWCREGAPRAVSLVSWTWPLGDEAPVKVVVTTQRGTRTIDFLPTTRRYGTPWRPTRRDEKDLAGWLEEKSDDGVTLQLADRSGRPLTAVYPGALGGLLQSLRGACHAAE